MRVHLVWVGRETRKGPEDELVQRYLTRLRSLLKWTEKAIKPVQGGNLSTPEIQSREGKLMTAEFGSQDLVVLCDERGEQLSSPQLARQLNRWMNAGQKRLCFCIGGARGVDDQVRRRADFMLSFSKMTLPHGLARVLLLEQVYRAICIQKGHPYHHEG